MDYGSNSFKSKENAEKKEQEIKVEKVVTGPVKLKNKNEFQKFVGRLLYDDMKTISTTFTNDVLFPILKNTLYELITKGLNVSLWGKATGASTSKLPSETVAYNSIFGKTSAEKKPELLVAGSNFAYDDIVFSSYGEAESVLVCMNEIIREYGRVRIADMYEMAGVSGKYTYNNYGWKDLSGTGIVRDKDGGYILKLPKAMPL